MKISNSSSPILTQFQFPSSKEKPLQPQEEKAIKLQDALITKIKELNQNISSLQANEKILFQLQEEIGELQSIKSQLSKDANSTQLKNRLENLRSRLEPILQKVAYPHFEKILEHPQKYQDLSEKTKKDIQALLKQREKEVESLFERFDKNVDLDLAQLRNPKFKKAHQLLALHSPLYSHESL